MGIFRELIQVAIKDSYSVNLNLWLVKFVKTQSSESNNFEEIHYLRVPNKRINIFLK